MQSHSTGKGCWQQRVTCGAPGSVWPRPATARRQPQRWPGPERPPRPAVAQAGLRAAGLPAMTPEAAAPLLAVCAIVAWGLRADAQVADDLSERAGAAAARQEAPPAAQPSRGPARRQSLEAALAAYSKLFCMRCLTYSCLVHAGPHVR